MPRPTRSPDAVFEGALRSARVGRFDEAADGVARVLRESPDGDVRAAAGANAFGEIARLAEDAGNLGAAERALRAALHLRPGYADLHFRCASLLLRGARRDEARRALEAALAINPHYVAARLELALLDAREGFVGEALESLGRLAGGPTVADPGAFQLALKRLERAEWDEADALLRGALGAEDSGLRRELDRVRELIDDGTAREAVTLLRSLVPRFAAYPDLHALLGRAEVALGHYDDAILSLSRALELNPDYHAARVLLAHALEGAGDVNQARRQIALVLDRQPDHAEALQRRTQWERAAEDPGATRRAA